MTREAIIVVAGGTLAVAIMVGVGHLLDALFA